MNSTQAKTISIVDYLSKLGYMPARTTEQRYTYISMLAPCGERTPSFMVSPDGRAFHDWSTGAAGSIVDLAMAIIRTRSVSDALSHIAQTMAGVAIPPTTTTFSFQQQQQNHPAPGIEIIAHTPVTSSALIHFARSRGITADILRQYCEEVHFHVRHKVYYAIGWPNQSGGWELRNKFAKMSAAPKDITVVNDLADCTMLVMEGFFDFLSAAMLRWFRPAEMNAVVLNSTAQVEKAIPVLQHATRIICLLDNDNAGRAATAKIRNTFPSAEDFSRLYQGHNDVNNFLRHK